MQQFLASVDLYKSFHPVLGFDNELLGILIVIVVLLFLPSFDFLLALWKNVIDIYYFDLQPSWPVKREKAIQVETS